MNYVYACLAYISSTLTKFPIDSSPKGEAPVSMGAVGFDKADLDKPFQYSARRGFGSLDGRCQFPKPEAAFPPKAGKHNQCI